MFATFADGRGARGTQVLVSDRPAGPFVPWSDGALTPSGIRCLDGTLHIDTDGLPWLIYCREWLDIHDGEIVAQRLEPSLRSLIGEPRLLFRASSAPWTRPLSPAEGGSAAGTDFVTDGPFLFRLPNGVLTMIWSSYGDGGYAIGAAVSLTGAVRGPWLHHTEPLWREDGGHGMVLARPGRLPVLVLHHPNNTPAERVRLIQLEAPTGEAVGLRRMNPVPAAAN